MPVVSIRHADQADAQAVADFVLTHPRGDISHTWEGGRLLHLSSGGRWETGLLLAERAGRIVGVLPRAVAGLKGLVHPACRSNGGPLVGLSEPAETWRALMDELVRYARSRHCFRLEMDLRIPETVGGEPYRDAHGEQAVEFSREYRLNRFPPPYRGTYWVCVEGDDEAILARLSVKLRRDLRVAWRKGVTVQVHRDHDMLVNLFDNYEMMLGRKHILHGLTKRYVFEGIWPCIQRGLAATWVTCYKGAICNQMVVALTFPPRGLIAASSPATRQKGMPPTGQVLHFGIMQAMRDAGRSVFDMGGATGPVPIEGHPKYGIWKFKYDFSGPYVSFRGRHYRPLSRLGDWVLQSALRAIAWFRRRREGRPADAAAPGGDAVEAPLGDE